MKLLIDTQVLIWVGQNSPRLSRRIAALLDDPDSELIFSTVSVAEVAIKRALKRADFAVDPGPFRAELLGNGYTELPLLGDHACRLLTLPPIHKDPFDRMLIAQALGEGIALVTADATLAHYPGQIMVV